MFSPYFNFFKGEGTRVQGKTIHASKGLEAKVVFIIGLTEGNGGFPDIWVEDRIFQIIKKANHDVEIAVDMLSLADKYDTAVLVSGDEDFSYAINAVAYKGVRVELAGFRTNTSPRLSMATSPSTGGSPRAASSGISNRM